MVKFKTVAAALLMITGFLLVIGAAGSDCDGKCMENALPMKDIIIYGLVGLFMMVLGGFIGGFFNEE